MSDRDVVVCPRQARILCAFGCLVARGIIASQNTRDAGPRCRCGPTPGREAVGMLGAHARPGTSPGPTGQDFVRILVFVFRGIIASHNTRDRTAMSLGTHARSGSRRVVTRPRQTGDKPRPYYPFRTASGVRRTIGSTRSVSAAMTSSIDL